MAHGRGGNIKVFAGSTNKALAELIAAKIDATVSPCEVRKFADGETGVSVKTSVRDEDVFIIQSGDGDCRVNDAVMELLIMTNAMKIASAGRIVAVIPYFPYSKQSKQKKRGAIPAKLVATMLKVAGVDQVLTMDLHHMEMQGFFEIPIDNIKASPLILQYIESNIPNFSKCVVVAKNAGASKRAGLVAKRLKLDFAMIFGEQTKFAECLSEEFLVEGDGSLEAATEEEADQDHAGSATGGPARSATMDELTEASSYGSSLIGNVEGRHCLLIDDMLDSAGPFVRAADLLIKSKATRVTVLCTHGLLSGTAPEEIEGSTIDSAVVTNSVPQADHLARCNKLKVIDCSTVLAECIRRVHNDESVLSLYGGAAQKVE